MQEEDLFNELIMTVFAEHPLALPYFGDLKFIKQKIYFYEKNMHIEITFTYVGTKTDTDHIGLDQKLSKKMLNSEKAVNISPICMFFQT